MGADPAFLHAVLCIPVRDRFCGGNRDQQQNTGRRAGDRGKIQGIFKRRQLHGPDRPPEDMRRGYVLSGAGDGCAQGI